ncbi:protein EARLY-RESPONSIVE TO DEHYDRATION 7, chloroplastic isoform X1 [Selaginella moellendorffii]|uniref:protein EARLY-RESPONSIVE TO DEHYDRATION 7, chloroplastic isoform X1 n=1 Tax=Selaginella moellendorffii TaxID=88036 RepID=UPI000D1C907A|nr:protein EARLY-RESPONSIVE TO DEHYDRATION 7, chloroplastic isoform X1 [Selaginella moellendorffii]XP_024541899.1 protein EARLY-RESPONSIVE TO DEHYDRATION 7, chloroplastic isoform X1 [Selaginella moellendorffii]|eukprot:XP_024541898.1 protein EARLY-RESPONSIVE TO DEHYDRATION 7, chloroplastic isoform X1 [Selaginella moellendorffii]
MGGKSSKSKQDAAENANSPPPGDEDPSVRMDPNSKLRVRSPDRPIPKYDQEPPQQTEGASDDFPVDAEEERELVAGEEGLVKISHSLVHLIDKEQSVLLGSGTFSLVRLTQNGKEVAVFARVGKKLQWPILKDEVVTKLDAGHYFFSLRVDPDDHTDRDDSHSERENPSKKESVENLSYGVTFKVKGNEEKLSKLDELLKTYTFFSKPKMMQGDEGEIREKLEAEGMIKPDEIQGQVLVPPPSLAQDMNKRPSETKSRLYWTAIAPNVEDYNSSIARGVATGTGHVIRSLFWCSNSTAAQLEKGGEYVRKHTKAAKKPVQLSPTTMRNIKRVRRVTQMSERVARGILTGIVTATGYFTSAAVTSKVGKKVFKMMPGEVALASLDAFSKVFDAVEMATQNILSTGTLITTGVVAHKFGEQAGEFTHEGLSSIGHVLSTAWVVSKIRKAINPKETKPSTRSMVKNAATNAIMRKK